MWTGSYKGGLPGYPFPPFSKCNRSVLESFSKFVYWFIAIDYTTYLSIELVSSPPQLYQDLSTNPPPLANTPDSISQTARIRARIREKHGSCRGCQRSSLQPKNSHFSHVSPASEGMKMKYIYQSGYFIYTYVRLITIPWLHQSQTHFVYFRARPWNLRTRNQTGILPVETPTHVHEYLCTCHRLGRPPSPPETPNNTPCFACKICSGGRGNVIHFDTRLKFRPRDLTLPRTLYHSPKVSTPGFEYPVILTLIAFLAPMQLVQSSRASAVPDESRCIPRQVRPQVKFYI